MIAASVAKLFCRKKQIKRQLEDTACYELAYRKAGEKTDKQQCTFAGKTFVITGSVYHFANRSELKNYIEERGGKVTGSCH